MDGSWEGNERTWQRTATFLEQTIGLSSIYEGRKNVFPQKGDGSTG